MFWASRHQSISTSQPSFSSFTWKRGSVWMYRTQSSQGTVLWFRYAFLKQYFEITDRAVGVTNDYIG